MNAFSKGILPLLMLTLLFSSCEKDEDGDKKTPGKNTWQLVLDNSQSTTEVYKLKEIVLRTNIKQVLEATSENNPGGGYNGVSSSLTLSFPTIGPPPSGTYTVTSYENLTSPDQVSIYVLTYGSPSNGGSHTGWFSQEGSSQTITYKFENGKASAVFNDIVVKQNGSSGPTTARVSANISQ